MTQYYSRTDIPYAGDSNFTIPFSYIDKTDIHVYINDTLISTWVWLNDSQINITSTLSAGDVVSIRRITPIDEKIVTYQNMSMVLNDDNLNLSQDQVLNAVQEVYDNNVSFQIDVNAQIDEIDTKVDTANATANQALSNSETAISIANEALSNSEDAVATANDAETKADNAVSTANTALSNASQAVSTANEANTNAQAAVSTANSAADDASEALSKANTAISTANTAKDTADIAKDTADEALADSATALANSETAINTANDAADDATEAVATANTANTNASNAVSTANSASSAANSAVSTANSASTAANNAVSTANTASTNASAAIARAEEAIEIAQTAVSQGLTPATTTTLGGIKVGDNLSITADGTLSADAQSIEVDDELSTTSENPVQNKVITNALNDKQEKLTAGTDLEIVEGSTLPAGYVQLKSITSTTTQYINTKISMTANYKAVIVGRLTQRPSSNFSTILGADNQNNNATTQGKYNVILGWGNAANGFYTENCIPSGAIVDYTYSSYPWDTETHTFTITVTPTRTMLNIDGTINTISLPPAAWDTPTPLYLFARNLAASGGISSITPFELEKIEQYQNGVLVFNGIPCKLGDIVGLYNTVTDEFLPNSGTGAFIEGDVIPNETIINFTNDSGYAKTSDLATVATSGSFNDLSNVPTLATVATTGSYNDLTNKPTIPTVGNGKLTLTQGGEELGYATMNQSGDTTINIPAVSNRNIGEIISSTLPLNDAGLHLLDGALMQGDGIYADFVDYIVGLVADYPDLFDTEANWQSTVAQYGVCGKFVYTQPTYQLIDTSSGTTGWYTHSLEVGSQVYATNGTPQITIASVSGNHITVTGAQAALFPSGFDRDTANDVSASVRLPKITGLVEGTTDVTALGDLVEAGLPNITGSITSAYFYKNYVANGAFSFTESWNTASNSGTDSRYGTFSFDSSNSNSIYGNSSTVQPQTIKVLYYIVVATSTKTDIQVDIDEIATDLNGKADRDGSNMVNSVKNFDGDWVHSFLRIAQSVSVSTSADQTYSLSSYLPNDGYNYEVLVGVNVSISTNSKFCNIYAHTDLFSEGIGIVGGSKSGTTYGFYSCGSAVLPVGMGRTITILKGSSTSAEGTYTINVYGYRRIGTNQ